MAPLLVTLRTETEETQDTEVSRSTCPYEVLDGGSYAKHSARPKTSGEKEERKRDTRERVRHRGREEER